MAAAIATISAINLRSSVLGDPVSSSAKSLVHRHGSLGVWAKLRIGVRSTLVLRVPAILLEEKCSMRLQHVHEQV
jgi:hypothetical protein